MAPHRRRAAVPLPKRPGEIRLLDSDKVVGRHEGLTYYTLGQREGAPLTMSYARVRLW